MESFWPSIQIEQLNWKRWRTRIDLAKAIIEYIGILYNRQRRHSQLNYESPVTHKLLYEPPSIPA